MKLQFLAIVYPAQNITFRHCRKPGKSLEEDNENVRQIPTHKGMKERPTQSKVKTNHRGHYRAIQI